MKLAHLRVALPGPRAAACRSARLDVPDLFSAVHDLLTQVPAGRVTTYGDLATALGSVTAARWVATYLLAADVPGELPCHRVVLRDGGLGKYFTGDASLKAARLVDEGVAVQGNAVDLERFRFEGFRGPRPLAELEIRQMRLLSHLRLEAPRTMPQLFGGVDVSYVTTSDTSPVEAVGAYALVNAATGALEWSATLRRIVRFPYIPGLLAFRELPLLVELLEQVREAGRLAPVVFVDGNGILHQRHAGIATHLGISAGLATIGVGKSLLCGRVDLDGLTEGESRPVEHAGQTVAMALRGTPRGRPIFISPGHNVDVPYALEAARRMLRGRRVPEPIHLAHALSRAVARS